MPECSQRPNPCDFAKYPIFPFPWDRVTRAVRTMPGVTRDLSGSDGPGAGTKRDFRKVSRTIVTRSPAQRAGGDSDGNCRRSCPDRRSTPGGGLGCASWAGATCWRRSAASRFSMRNCSSSGMGRNSVIAAPVRCREEQAAALLGGNSVPIATLACDRWDSRHAESAGSAESARANGVTRI